MGSGMGECRKPNTTKTNTHSLFIIIVIKRIITCEKYNKIYLLNVIEDDTDNTEAKMWKKERKLYTSVGCFGKIFGEKEQKDNGK